MNSRTSRSLAPFESCSRIWLRRSTASGAFDSASVWFWHTRQRSSSASEVTFRSSSSAASALETKQRNSRTLATAQLLHLRQQLLLRHFGRERSDVLVTDHALLVDDVGLRHAVHAVVDGDAAGGVEHRELIR